MWMPEKYMKKCSKSVVIREMLIKTTMRYHNRPIRMAESIEKTECIKYRWGCGATGTSTHC